MLWMYSSTAQQSVSLKSSVINSKVHTYDQYDRIIKAVFVFQVKVKKN